MELKKLHMGTMSYGADSMDEVAHQLALAFGLNAEQGITNLTSHQSLIKVEAFQRLFDKDQLQQGYNSLLEAAATCLQG